MKNSPEQTLKRVVFKLRFYRESANVSQREAAEKLNIGHRSYQRIESGEASCDISFLHRFCLTFNVDFIDLACPNPPKNSNIDLFINKEEQIIFEKMQFVKETNFKNLVSSFETHSLSFGETELFAEAEHPFCIWTPNKNIVNNNLLELLGKSINTTNSNMPLLLRDEKINALDCLYYYRPKYSLKKIVNYNLNGTHKPIDLFSAHFYEKNEVKSISLLKFN